MEHSEHTRITSHHIMSSESCHIILLSFQTVDTFTVIFWAVPEHTVAHTAIAYKEQSDKENQTTYCAGFSLQEKTCKV